MAPFVAPSTKRKIRFLSGAAARRALLQRMGPQVLPQRYGGEVELVPIDGAMTAWRRQQAGAAAAAADADAASFASGASASGRAAALRRRAGKAAHAARSFAHGALVRPVGGAAAGVVRALRRHHVQLLRRHAHHAGGSGGQQSEQQRSLLAQVVLTHVLLVALVLRMLQRVLLRRPPSDDGSKGQLEPLPGAASGEDEARPQECGGSSLAAEPAGPS